MASGTIGLFVITFYGLTDEDRFDWAFMVTTTFLVGMELDDGSDSWRRSFMISWSFSMSKVFKFSKVF